MKKFLLIIILLLGFCISAFSQRTIRYNTGIYGGANLSENTPLAGAFISADIFWFRIEFDAGWSYTYANGSRNDFFYINPSDGRFSVQNTIDLATGTYSVSLTCTSGGVEYDYPGIITVEIKSAE